MIQSQSYCDNQEIEQVSTMIDSKIRGGGICRRCGVVKTIQNTSIFARQPDPRLCYRTLCKSCYNRDRKRRTFQKVMEKTRPTAPAGHQYCKKCGDSVGPLPLNQFPFRHDAGQNPRRRGVCYECVNKARREFEKLKRESDESYVRRSQERDQAVYEANANGTAQPHYAFVKLDLAILAKVTAEKLEAMHEKPSRKPSEVEDPIQWSIARYRAAWTNIKRIIKTPDYRDRPTILKTWKR